MPKILLMDIETAPSLGYFFDLWKEGNILDTAKDWYVLSFAAKWLGEKKTKVWALPDYPGYKKNQECDKALLGDLWQLLNEADIVVAHNGDRFDIRKVNARFIVHGLRPPSPYRSIDTLKIARKYFKFDSNRLDDLGRYFGIGRKLPHIGKALWLGCMAGDKKAWDTMKRYNARDVELLEPVWQRLRAWAPNHRTLYTRRLDDCPACESTKVQARGFVHFKASKKQRFQCQDCGHWYSGSKLIRE